MVTGEELVQQLTKFVNDSSECSFSGWPFQTQQAALNSEVDCIVMHFVQYFFFTLLNTAVIMPQPCSVRGRVAQDLEGKGRRNTSTVGN